MGYPEWGDLLGLGEGIQKWEEMRKLQVGPPKAQVPPSRVAIVRPTLGSWPAVFQRLPAHTAFACLAPLCPQPLLGSVLSTPFASGALRENLLVFLSPPLLLEKSLRTMGEP